jgi:transglutaminase-like putative cysteine protease
MSRPVGVSAGGLGLVLAWLGGVGLAQLTGSTPVLIVLAAGLVMFVVALVGGWRVVRAAAVGAATLPQASTQGDPFSLRIEIVAQRPLWVEVSSFGNVVASGWTHTDTFSSQATLDRRGRIRELDVLIRSGGSLGLIWWMRRVTIEIPDHVVAPRPHRGAALIERRSMQSDGDRSGAPGAAAGEIDGIRPWREGDSERFVHWSSTLRTGELVVHDRLHDADQRWLVRARHGVDDPDAEAGSVRWALEQGLRTGAKVFAAVGSGEPTPIVNQPGAAYWTAMADLGPPVGHTPTGRRRFAEPESAAPVSARWWAAGATLVALLMLTGALGFGVITTSLIAVAIATGAIVSARSLATGEPASGFVRAVVAIVSLGSLVMFTAASGQLDGVLSILTGPLPQILVTLILLHGFECRDRRTIRVGLGISAIVIMYASGFRVDGSIGLWLLGWAGCFCMTLIDLAGPRTKLFDDGGAARILGWRVLVASVVAAATVAVLMVVPVPDGPARLTLPTFIDDASVIGTAGGLATANGAISRPGDEGNGQRAAAGRSGGYTGFAESMDTSVRGALSDEVVMRVRASEPDFWRGQTFSMFDGRRWYADEPIGSLRGGPNIEVPPALGDIPVEFLGDVSDDVPGAGGIDRFVQTYYLETDFPNVVFAAYRPIQLILDADVWTRDDGAIRASVTLPEGSVYTVVSARARITESMLRDQGLIGPRLNAFGTEVFARYLQLPDSTSSDTFALADRLAAGQASTYDVIRAYEAWLDQNVVYDLDAPVPDSDANAVDDFLFESRRGFCEQIASALTIMLRTQGVPARVATGYLSGERDQIAGVFEVRARDAHAWVEVWFPETGWQAFDPTASVPLSGDTSSGSIGADVVAGIDAYVRDHTLLLGLLAAGALGSVGGVRLAGLVRYRRRRGRWGVLQDRFESVALKRGVVHCISNPGRAAAWSRSDDVAVARLIAERLDRVAFDPTFDDDEALYRATRKLVMVLRSDDR